MPDASHRAFEARGVLEPLLWILGSGKWLFAAESRKKAA